MDKGGGTVLIAGKPALARHRPQQRVHLRWPRLLRGACLRRARSRLVQARRSSSCSGTPTAGRRSIRSPSVDYSPLSSLPESTTMNRFSTRRQFLSNAGLAGVGIAAASSFSLPGYAQASGTYRARLARPGRAARRFQSAPVRRLPRAPRDAPSTRAFTIPAIRSRTSAASARTSSRKSPTCTCPSSVTPAATWSRATTGGMAWARRRTARRCSSAPGTRSRPTSSAPTTSWTGPRPWAPSRCWASTSAPAPPKWPWPISNTATTPRARSGASCGARMATTSRTR